MKPSHAQAISPGVQALRLSLVVIYIWFGALKLVDQSPACALVEATGECVPIIPPKLWVYIMGWGEVTIGILLLFRRTVQLAVSLIFGHMIGACSPLILLPELSFESGYPFTPTMAGQYMIKNLIIVSAAIAISGVVWERPKRAKS